MHKTARDNYNRMEILEIHDSDENVTCYCGTRSIAYVCLQILRVTIVSRTKYCE